MKEPWPLLGRAGRCEAGDDDLELSRGASFFLFFRRSEGFGIQFGIWEFIFWEFGYCGSCEVDLHKERNLEIGLDF
ncbi:hypothetical protein Taro_009792 [Colocasia esculenta]|uniref:Uncharacterized protein n=1 Tax=Colocasia esculenta TaxID=4460 RepID=A0A843U6N7_COLES|nr:hypothetical protein [Colocasia esculenta]